MKKLTKKLGMSTLALASVFTVGMLSVKTSSVSVNNEIATYSTSAPSYINNDVTNASNGVEMKNTQEVAYSYNIETTGTGSTATSSLEFKVDINIDADRVKQLTYFNGVQMRAEYAITLESEADTRYNDEEFITTATNYDVVSSELTAAQNDSSLIDNQNTITLDTTSTSDASMTSVRAALNDLEPGKEYTLRIYLGTSNGWTQTTLNSSLDLATELAPGRASKVVEFTFKTPEVGGDEITAGQTNTAPGVWTGNALTQTSNSYYSINATHDDSAGSYLNYYSVEDKNLVVTNNAGVTGNFTLALNTAVNPTNDSDATDGNNSALALEFTATLPSSMVNDNGTFYYGVSLRDNSVLVDADPENDVTAVYTPAVAPIKETAVNVDGTYIWDAVISSAALTNLESDTQYTVRIHASETALTGADLIANTDDDTLFTFTFWTPQSATGNTTWTGYSVRPTTEYTTTAITAIVLASIFGVTTIGLGAYIVVNNNKSKKASTPVAK